MRSLVEIAKDIRAVQRTMYSAEIDALECGDGLGPDHTDSDHKYSELMREFSKTLGFFETDEFANAQHIIHDTVQKYLDNKSLEDHYFDLQDYLDYEEEPTIEGLKKIIHEREFY